MIRDSEEKVDLIWKMWKKTEMLCGRRGQNLDLQDEAVSETDPRGRR